MIRQMIKIDEDKCNGCGLCTEACHEAAIEIIDGKAKVIRDDFCDGLGNCLPVCPTGAITFEDREAAAYDQSAVDAHLARTNPAKALEHAQAHAPHAGGCPGMQARQLSPKAATPTAAAKTTQESQLRQWPVQIKLVPINAPYYQGAHLLIAADCTAYAYANFHEEFIKNHIAIIGCPKLDDIDYSEKLTAIIRENDIKSVTIVRMEVPCCGGISHAATVALKESGKFIPWNIVTIGTDGSIIAD
jgi:ferredoxin